MNRILVVEDAPDLARLVQLTLERAGCAVDLARDGAGALALAGAEEYDLVVLDLRLPVLDGVTVLKRLLEARPGLSVLILSAMGDVDTKVRLLELGATDFVAKPFEPAELVARVRARLRQVLNGGEGYLRGGGLSLDLRGRTVEFDGSSIPLSTREFLVLQYLLRRRGEICTREQLLADVWGFSFDPGTNLVEVCVRRLRKKVGLETIRTVRNGGYYIDAG